MSHMHSTVGTFGTIGVLKALEEAARRPNVGIEDFSQIFGKEKWAANWNAKILDAPLSQETSIADPSSISHIMASAFQIDNIVSMLKSLTSVAVEFQDRYKQFATSISSKLSRGFASIPDELLPIIFEFAVRAEGRMGARQAVRLSHVSRHFRDIALAERSLWSTIHIRSRAWNLKEELETIISRSGGNTDFNVFVDIDPDEFHIGKDNIVVFAATSSRWRTLSLTECDRKWYEEELVGVRNVSVDSILQMFFHTGVVQLPHLQELSIRSEDSRRSLSTISCQWVSPSLRSLRCFDYTLSPSTAFASVTEFSFSQSPSSHNYSVLAKNLLPFLASMPSVTDVELILLKAEDIKIEEHLHLPASVCPSVTSFHLRLPMFTLLRGRQSFIASFLASLHMPRLEAMSISINFKNMGETESECTDLLCELSNALLPVHFADPRARLSSLNYELTYEPDSGFYSTPRTPLKYFPRIFTIPLDRIPSISNLTVTTCTRVCFTRGGHVGRREPCRLRDIRFIGCGDMELADLQPAIQSLKGIGVWENIERVVVEDCRSLAYDEALELVGMERLRSSANHLLRPSHRSVISTSPSQSQLVTKPISKLASNTDVDVPFKISEKKRINIRSQPSVPARVASSNRFGILDDDNTQ